MLDAKQSTLEECKERWSLQRAAEREDGQLATDLEEWVGDSEN